MRPRRTCGSSVASGTTNGSGIGARLPRREDARLLTGRAPFLDDIRLPGMLHVAFLRSYAAHAKLVSVNAERAQGFAILGLLDYTAGWAAGTPDKIAYPPPPPDLWATYVRQTVGR